MGRERLDPDALPIELRQRPGRKLLALILAAVTGICLVAAVALVAVGVDERSIPTVLAGIGLLAVAGPLWVYWALQLVPGSCRLRVTTAGFSVRHCFVTHERGWDEVGRFYTRTYSTPRINDYVTVAFTGEESKVIGIWSFLDELRIRGIADTDILPDTYGQSAGDLAAFMNACSERYGQRSPDHVPDSLPVTRGYMIGITVVLSAFIVAFLAWAGTEAAAGDAPRTLFALVLASPVAFALAHGWVRWRRGTMRRGTTLRGPS